MSVVSGRGVRVAVRIKERLLLVVRKATRASRDWRSEKKDSLSALMRRMAISSWREEGSWLGSGVGVFSEEGGGVVVVVVGRKLTYMYR